MTWIFMRVLHGESGRPHRHAALLESVLQLRAISLRGIDEGGHPAFAEAGGRLLDAIEFVYRLVRRQAAGLAVEAGDGDLDPAQLFPRHSLHRLDAEGVVRCTS